MTPRQSDILDYHRDLASFGTTSNVFVFVILDLEDSEGFKIASFFQTNCADKRDTIKATGAFPAFTLALSIKDANALLAHGWPTLKKIETIPEGMVPVILICEERCLSVFMKRE